MLSLVPSISFRAEDAVTSRNQAKRLKIYRRTNNSCCCVDYRALAQFRHQLREFLSFGEAAARKENLTPQQHQAMLAIKGFSQAKPVSVGELATILLIRHHTAVELTSRMTRLGLVERTSDRDDARRVLVQLTSDGERRLRRLSKFHLQELNTLGKALTKIF